MRSFPFFQLSIAAMTALAQKPGEDGKYTISALGIKAQVRI